MINQIKRGNDIPIKFSVIEGGALKDMSAMTDLRWSVCHADHPCRKELPFEVIGIANPWTVVVKTKPTDAVGVYYIGLTFRDRAELRKIDAVAFQLTAHTPATSLTECSIKAVATTCIGAIGLSAYELYQQHNPESTLTQEQYAAAPIVAAGMATDLIESAAELEGQIVRAEELRGEGEGTRERSETLRVGAEARRVLAEGERATAETTRAKTEDGRGIVETLRVDAEGRRVLAEDKRVTADAHRDTTEKQRTATEAARVEAEGLRATAEQGRQTTTTSAIERTNSATTTATEAAASIIDPLEVLAHSDCSMEERVANLEKALISLITGEMLIPMLSVEKLDVWKANNIVLSGGGAPAHSPSRAGQLYIDTTNKAVYFSTGNSSVADWNH